MIVAIVYDSDSDIGGFLIENLDISAATKVRELHVTTSSLNKTICANPALFGMSCLKNDSRNTRKKLADCMSMKHMKKQKKLEQFPWHDKAKLGQEQEEHTWTYHVTCLQ